MDHASLVDSSKEHIALADHLLQVTFPLLRDPKILGAALQAVFVAASRSAHALIGNIDLPFQQRLEMFKQVVQEHELRSDYVDLLQDLQSNVKKIKTSSTIFSRKEKLVILDQEDQVEISVDQVRNLSFRTKSLIADVVEREHSSLSSRYSEVIEPSP